MADQADILDMLQAVSAAACYPNGQSVTTRVIDIGQGWPLAKDIDNAFATGVVLVSIIAINGTTAAENTPFDWNPGTVAASVHGLSAMVSGDTFTLNGAPNPGEYATAIVNGTAYSVAAQVGDTAEVLAASLASEINAVFSGTTWAPVASGASVTIPGSVKLEVLIGAPATVGQISHRQRQNFQITVWAPTPSDRTAASRAIDVVIKASLQVTLPDTSEAIVRAQGSNIDDKRQETSGFHRALIYNIEWDTLDEYPAWEITAPSVPFSLVAS